MQRLLNKKFIIFSLRNYLQAQKIIVCDFELFSLKCCFFHLMYAFCKRHLTCTINMPSILNAMLEYHIGNA